MHHLLLLAAALGCGLALSASFRLLRAGGLDGSSPRSERAAIALIVVAALTVAVALLATAWIG